MERTCVIQVKWQTSRLERTALPLTRTGCSVQAEYAGMLEVKASEINAEAYELLDTISEQYIKREMPEDCGSTMGMWKLREQARQLSEEMVLQEVVLRCR